MHIGDSDRNWQVMKFPDDPVVVDPLPHSVSLDFAARYEHVHVLMAAFRACALGHLEAAANQPGVGFFAGTSLEKSVEAWWIPKVPVLYNTVTGIPGCANCRLQSVASVSGVSKCSMR